MYIYQMEDFGTIDRIKEWIQEQPERITQEKFAEMIDVNSRNVRNWFNGTASIRRKNLTKIAEVMDCDVEYLECKQNAPRRSTGVRIRLSDLSLSDRALDHVRSLYEATGRSLKISIVPGDAGSEVVTDSFIDGDKRYYYEDLDRAGEIRYKIQADGREPVERSESEVEEFCKNVMKYLSFAIDDLTKED